MNPNDSRGRIFNYRVKMMDEIPPMPVWDNPYQRVPAPPRSTYLDQHQSTQDLYRLSETALWPDTSTYALDARPAQFNLGQVYDLYETIRNSEIARKLWPQFAARPAPVVRIVDRNSDEGYRLQGGARTDLDTRTVIFTNNGFALSREAVLHELAHVISLDMYGYETIKSGRVLGHGVEFARIYVKLLENFLDPMVARRLEDTLEHGSPYFKGVRDDNHRSTVSDTLDEIDRRIVF